MLCKFLSTMDLEPLPLGKGDVGKEGFIQESVVCKVTMFRKLATYMMELKKEDGSWKYHPGTVKNRFGEAKLQIEKMFGKQCVNRNDPECTKVTGTKRGEAGDDAWFSMLKSKLDREMMHRCQMTGTVIYNMLSFNLTCDRARDRGR
jgi:hypothetical protein